MPEDLFDDEVLAGYLDGLDPASPEPSENRSNSYRNGFANGRDDLRKVPRASAQTIREAGEMTRKMDLDR